jgi:wyosine [tRNA(Phe)-imidazoG37] synthetase (radical SAM superfamily)
MNNPLAGSEAGNPVPLQEKAGPHTANGADPQGPETAFGRPRNAMGNRYAYAVISQRARGLSLGVNLNPDKRCNFDCVYCEVNRDEPPKERTVDVGTMAAELTHLLDLARRNELRRLAWFRNLPPELLQLKEVALSGDGEPTLCPNFSEVVGEVLSIRSRAEHPFFKIVLITNATGLDTREVAHGLRRLAREDEIWVKLDAGTPEYMNKVNRPSVPLWRILANILTVARERPVIIQSLFPLINRQAPPLDEIEQYVERLKELTVAGAQIAMVQVYSAHRPPHRPQCEHLPLKTLSHIARRVREVTGLKAEVF